MHTSTYTRRRLPLLLLALGVAGAALTALPPAAPATVEEQRLRLPPPAHDCDDPVTGTWIGQHRPHTWWSRYTLTVRREAPGSPRLVGNIETRAWTGGPQDTAPLPCSSGESDVIVDQPATGSFEGQHIQFGASSWSLREARCGGLSDYFPDTFDGDVDPGLNEFQTTREDGHNATATVVFRRIRCAPAPEPAAIPDLPELPPPRPEARGCSCL